MGRGRTRIHRSLLLALFQDEDKEVCVKALEYDNRLPVACLK